MSAPRVLISGGSRGIGLAVAKAFLAEGARVAMCSTTAEGVRRAEIEASGLQGVVADLRRAADADRVAAWAEEALGGVDVLVNNAGRFVQGGLAEQASADFSEVIRANLDSAIFLTRACLPALKRSRHATIINMGSVASTKGYPTGVAYSVAKHGLLGLSRSLREELKPDRIAVVAILPGATLTDSWAGAGLPEERFMRPSDVADVVTLSHRISRTAVLEEVLMRPIEGDI